MQQRWFWLLVGFIALMLWAGGGDTAQAHSSLVRSDPTPNAILLEAPSVIHLWFSEPMEGQFSRAQLFDSEGQPISASSQLDSSAKRLSLTPPALTDGLYHVSWRAVSTSDGHATQGSFAFAVDEGFSSYGQMAANSEPLPLGGALLRAFNLLGLGVLVGLSGFAVWMGLETARHPWWLAWGMVGLGGLGLLGLQLSLVSAGEWQTLPTLLTETRFGHLWLLRLLLWALIGLSLWFGQVKISLVLGLGLLLTQSLFSHASGVAQGRWATVASDWLHLTLMSLWLGGLVGLLAQVRQAPPVSELVARFSVYARLLVFGLAVTGLYAAWVQVGSWEGLTQTAYGQSLLFKLALMLPLLAIAGINLAWTSRRLAQGQAIWMGALRGLIRLEIALLVGIVVTVGLMTALAPARKTLAERASAPPPIQAVEHQTSLDGLSVTVRISSDVIGANLYSLRVSDSQGQPFVGVTGVGLTLQHQTLALRPSQLRPQPKGDGLFSASGANINAPGEWAITVALEGLAVEPFTFESTFQAPPPLSPPALDLALPSQQQSPLLGALGGLLLMGGLLLCPRRLGWSAQWTAYATAGLGGLLLLSGALLWQDPNAEAQPASAFQAAPDAPARIQQARNREEPLVINGAGRVFAPQGSGRWSPMGLQASINDLYMDTGGNLWAAAEDGLYVQPKNSNIWERVQQISTYRMHESHGFLFVLSDGLLIRSVSGALDPEAALILALPDTQAPGHELLMLGNHTHAVLNGASVYVTPDLGLTWQALDAPLPVERMYTDSNGYLLASTAEGLYEWTWERGTWRTLGGLPDGQAIQTLKLFQNRLFALAGGQLYYRTGGSWAAIAIPDSSGGYLNALALHYPDRLWLLDAAQGRLWSSGDGMNWQAHALQLEATP
jgi:copper transport protein